MVLSKVGLTGASGMVGRHVAALLADDGISVRATSRRRPASLPANADWQPWDLCDWASPGSLDDIFGGVDAIVHAGAAVPNSAQTSTTRALFDANVRGTMCLGAWARDRGIPLVHLSGAIVYRETGGSSIKETDPVEVQGFGGFYRATKVLAEQALAATEDAGSPITILRPTSIYGAGLDKTKLAASLLSQAERGEEIAIDPPADDRINLVHAWDVARAVRLVLANGSTGMFNIGGETTTIEGLARACVSVAGCGRVTVKAGRAERDPTSRFDVDGGAARRGFGYDPTIDVEAGLRLMSENRLSPMPEPAVQ